MYCSLRVTYLITAPQAPGTGALLPVSPSHGRIGGLQVVVTAGNHDSPSLLNAPKALLRTLDIHVIGSVTGNAGDEVLVLKNREGSLP